jgi:DNA-binding transcriptional MerR regulator
MRTLTVNDIAEKIRRPGEDLRVAGDRIRNWTREGLLSTVGDKHPGTGRSRLYSPKALVEAGLVQVLTDCTGIAVHKIAPLLKEAKKRADLISLVSDIRAAGVPVLIICRSSGESEWEIASCQLEEFPEFALRKAYDTYTIIDLKRLFDTLPQE